MNLRDKNIIITGSTGGIGKELVNKLDSKEANLILISKSEDELKIQSRNLRSKNYYFACDFSDQEEVKNLAKKISKQCKVIDVIINCAGIGIYKAIEDSTLEDWNNSLNINAAAPFILVSNLSKNLQKSKSSVVLNIGSGAGVIPMAGRSLYCTSKFALRGLTLSLAEEYRRTSVDFCLITLGSVLTGFGPKGIDDKKRDMESGKAYFTPDWVAGKLIEIVKDDGRLKEYTMFPSNYKNEWTFKG